MLKWLIIWGFVLFWAAIGLIFAQTTMECAKFDKKPIYIARWLIWFILIPLGGAFIVYEICALF